MNPLLHQRRNPFVTSMVFLSIVVCFFSGIPGRELLAQLASLGLLGIGGFWALTTGRAVASALSGIEWVLAGIAVLSTTTSLATGNTGALTYTLIFSATCLAVGL